MEAATPAPAGKHIDPGKVIGETFRIYREQFAVLILTALAVFIVAGLLQGLSNEIGGVFGSLLGTIINLVAVALFTGFVVKLVEDVRDGRRDFSAGELLSAAAPAIGALIVNSILRGIAIGIGLLLLIVPGLYLLTIWAVTSPAIVAEKEGALEAFGRSNSLVKGEGWPVFATILLAFLITIVVSIVAVGIGAGIGDAAGAIILGIIASALTAPIAALVATVLFFDLGGRSVGADVGAPATTPPPAPPAPPA